MRKRLLLLFVVAIGLGFTPAAHGQGYTDALLTSINQNTDFPCGNGAGSDTGNIQQAIAAAAHFGGGTVDLTCYQHPISITANIFSGVSAPILLYLPEHAVTVTVAATIPSNFEICGGPGSSIGGGSLTNNASACFNGFTGGGGGTPGGADGTIQYNHAGSFGGILNSAVDPSTGDVTLGAGFIVDSIADQIFIGIQSGIISLNIEHGGSGGINLDSTGSDFSSAGTGPITLTSAGGVITLDTSAAGHIFQELGTGGFSFENLGDGSTNDGGAGVGIYLGAGSAALLARSGSGTTFLDTSAVGMLFDATGNGIGSGPGTGILQAFSAGGVSITDNSANPVILIENGNGGILLEENGTASPGIQITSSNSSVAILANVAQLLLNNNGEIDLVGTIFTFNGDPILTALTGVTSAIGGSALTLGQQATGTASITGASAAVAVGGVIKCTPTVQGAPGDGFLWSENLTATDTVTVKTVCLVAGTPTSSTYNCKVF